MKTILFLLLSFMCHAQQQAGQVGVTLEYTGDPFEIKFLEPKFDTTKIVMLVSDTTEIYIREVTIENNPISSTGEYRTRRHYKRADPVYWMYGYMVPEFDKNIAERINPLMEPVFLDLSKKPISKAIIIWDWRKVD
jgi:hypothetical protein